MASGRLIPLFEAMCDFFLRGASPLTASEDQHGTALPLPALLSCVFVQLTDWLCSCAFPLLCPSRFVRLCSCLWCWKLARVFTSKERKKKHLPRCNFSMHPAASEAVCLITSGRISPSSENLHERLACDLCEINRETRLIIILPCAWSGFSAWRSHRFFQFDKCNPPINLTSWLQRGW